MAMIKRSISIDRELARAVTRASAEDGRSFSAWLSEAAEQRLRIREGLRGVATWERQAGALSGAEITAGETLLDGLLGQGARRRRVRRSA